MKKIYLLLLLPVIISSCSFRLYKSYEDKIISTWELSRVKVSRWDKPENMAFTRGVFRFYPSGNLEYKDQYGHIYSGTWIMKDVRIHSSSDSSGSSVTSLYITVVDFENHVLKTEIFDDMIFFGQSSFRAYLDRKGRNIFYFNKLQ